MLLQQWLLCACVCPAGGVQAQGWVQRGSAHTPHHQLHVLVTAGMASPWHRLMPRGGRTVLWRVSERG